MILPQKLYQALTAGGTRATVPYAKSTIALYTERDQQSAIVVDCRPCLPARLLSPPGAVNTRPPAVAVYIALVDSRQDAWWRQFSKFRVWDEVPDENGPPLFLEIS